MKFENGTNGEAGAATGETPVQLGQPPKLAYFNRMVTAEPEPCSWMLPECGRARCPTAPFGEIGRCGGGTDHAPNGESIPTVGFALAPRNCGLGQPALPFSTASFRLRACPEFDRRKGSLSFQLKSGGTNRRFLDKSEMDSRLLSEFGMTRWWQMRNKF